MLRHTLCTATVGALLLVACNTAPPAQLPTDVVTAYQCIDGDVAKGVTSFTQIAKDCTGGVIQVVVDVVDLLLMPSTSGTSSAFAVAHADRVPALKAELAVAKFGKPSSP